MWNCCLASKAQLDSIDKADRRPCSETATPDCSASVVNCARCSYSQSVLESVRAYICPKCFSVNSISSHSKQQSVVDITQFDVLEIPFTFRAFESADTKGSSGSRSLPDIASCSVCMEEPGDIVLLPCRHGAICEDCARFIVGNNAVGGQKCPKCRQQISQILKLAEVTHTIITAVNLPMGVVASGPPRVPPPPGSRKKQVTLSCLVCETKEDAVVNN